jgi:hypothetical protein
MQEKSGLLSKISFDDVNSNPTKPSDQNSVKDNVSIIDSLAETAFIQLKNFKRDATILKQETQLMSESAAKLVEQTQCSLLPFIQADYDKLLSLIKQQSHENASLQKQITELQNDKASIENYMASYESRIAFLEDQVGN